MINEHSSPLQHLWHHAFHGAHHHLDPQPQCGCAHHHRAGDGHAQVALHSASVPPRWWGHQCGACGASLGRIGASPLGGGGSLPPDAPPNFYADIAQMARAQQKKLVLDASGPGLEVPVRSTIGAGDTFVGAFVSTLDQMHPDTSPSTLCQALRHAMAASAAALASLGTALCQAEEVATWLDAVQVISLED